MPMTKLHISDDARADLAEIKAYISDELGNPAAAKSTVKNITRRIRELQNFPLMGPALSSVSSVSSDFRYLVSGNYLIFYQVKQGEVYIARVMYGRRNYIQLLFEESIEDEPEE